MNLLIIFAAKYLYILVIFLGLGFFITSKLYTKKNIVFALAVLGLTLVLGKVASLLYYDSRPFVVKHFTPLVPHAANNGFPSDHGLLVFAITAVIYFFDKRAGLLLFFLSLLVEGGRILAGIHSPVDVLGSFVLSVVALFIAKSLILKKT